METNKKFSKPNNYQNNRNNNNGGNKGLSRTEHSKLQLIELFPTVDAPFIEKLFKLNEYDLELTISQVC